MQGASGNRVIGLFNRAFNDSITRLPDYPITQLLDYQCSELSQRVDGRDAASRESALAIVFPLGSVQEDRAHAGGERAVDVLPYAVAHHDGFIGSHVHELQRRREDARM